MKLVRLNNPRTLTDVHREFDRVIDRFFSPDFFDNSESGENRWVPNMDAVESKDDFRLTLELPGLKKEDVKLTYNDGIMTIEGERRQEERTEDQRSHRVERRYGKFLRSFRMPTEVVADKIGANFKDGVLTVTLPKAEEVKPKEIQVKIS